MCALCAAMLAVFALCRVRKIEIYSVSAADRRAGSTRLQPKGRNLPILRISTLLAIVEPRLQFRGGLLFRLLCCSSKQIVAFGVCESFFRRQ